MGERSEIMALFRGPGFEFALGNRKYFMGIVDIQSDFSLDYEFLPNGCAAVEQARALECRGADIVGFSARGARRGAALVPEQESIRGLRPVLEQAARELHAPILVETSRPLVAEMALSSGASIISDPSGFVDPDMSHIVSRYHAAAVITHPGEKSYPLGVTRHVRDFLLNAARKAQETGIPKESLCLDPGLEVGKSYAVSMELLMHIGQARPEGYAFLLGGSRKVCVGAGLSGRQPANYLADPAVFCGCIDIFRICDAETLSRAVCLHKCGSCASEMGNRMTRNVRGPSGLERRISRRMAN